MGLEVLNVIEDEQLQQNALDVGAYTRGLVQRAHVHRPTARGAGIGDVRGMGLSPVWRSAKDRRRWEPDAETAAHVMHWARTHANVLVSTDGPHANIIKMKPPLPASAARTARYSWPLSRSAPCAVSLNHGLRDVSKQNQHACVYVLRLV